MRLPQGSAPSTIYFGGGTPSMLSPTHLEILVNGLRDWLDLSQVQEWSFESNPATFTAAKVQHWRRLGINRVSLGVQSFDAGLLKLLGREHTPEDVAESVQLLRDAGIPQVNIDLMFSLPGQSLQQWERTLQSALSLQPDHLSTYNLSYEEDTDFFRLYGAEAGNEETDVAMFSLADDMLTSAGYRHYEISNYARTGCKSLHNLACWHGEDYCGLGPGAVGTMMGIRYCNDGNTAAYTAALQSGTLPPGTVETLAPETRRTEMLGLLIRTDEGIPASLLRLQDSAFIAMLQNEKLATVSADGRLILTRAGRLVADEIAVGLI